MFPWLLGRVFELEQHFLLPRTNLNLAFLPLFPGSQLQNSPPIAPVLSLKWQVVVTDVPDIWAASEASKTREGVAMYLNVQVPDIWGDWVK